ncbi:MAG: hypothetical protein M3Y54_19265 [Bacteroidota bacterium]|nr:hypothetical protein [Bacteroidota bacterium]
MGYGFPTLLPSLGFGWRTRRFTLSLDGQFYTNEQANGLLRSVVGANFVARGIVAYRLGRNPDAAPAR